MMRLCAQTAQTTCLCQLYCRILVRLDWHQTKRWQVRQARLLLLQQEQSVSRSRLCKHLCTHTSGFARAYQGGPNRRQEKPQKLFAGTSHTEAICLWIRFSPFFRFSQGSRQSQGSLSTWEQFFLGAFKGSLSRRKYEQFALCASKVKEVSSTKLENNPSLRTLIHPTFNRRN